MQEKSNCFKKISEYKKWINDYISKKDWVMVEYYKKRLEFVERKLENKKKEKIKIN
jgi:hypothetical protein